MSYSIAKRLLLSSVAALASLISAAQHYRELPSGLSHSLIKKGKGKHKAQAGDIATMHITFKISDSVIIDSKVMNSQLPIEQPLSEPSYPGDVFEGILKMKKGEISSFRLPVKEFYQKSGQTMPTWVNPERFASWDVHMVTLRTPAEAKKAVEKQAKTQLKKDSKLIADFLKSKKVNFSKTPYTAGADSNVAYKTPTGLVYTVLKEGSGEAGLNDRKVSLNYTGWLLKGEVFDSNTDPKFGHVEPLFFEVGKNQMIKGWDQALPYMKTGQKIRLYIPSPLAYGPQSRPPAIPANAILVFDMELLTVDPIAP